MDIFSTSSPRSAQAVKLFKSTLLIFFCLFSISSIVQASNYPPIVYELPIYPIATVSSYVSTGYIAYKSSPRDTYEFKNITCTGNPDEQHLCAKKFNDEFSLQGANCGGGDKMLSCEIVTSPTKCYLNTGLLSNGYVYAKAGFCDLSIDAVMKYEDYYGRPQIEVYKLAQGRSYFMQGGDREGAPNVLCSNWQLSENAYVRVHFQWGAWDERILPECAPWNYQYNDLVNIYNPLSDFYQDLSGTDWLDDTNWLDEGVSICEWNGVSCENIIDKNMSKEYLRTVTKIDLVNHKLTGKIPDSFYFVVDSLLGHHADFTWDLRAKNPKPNPLPEAVVTDYPLLLAKLKETPSLVTKFGDKVCYPDTHEFTVAFTGTDWLKYACNTEAESCPVENTGPECIEGNPINARTGIKMQSATDYSASGKSSLRVKRSYSSSKDASKRAWQFNTNSQSLRVGGNYVKLKGRSKSNNLFYCSATAPSTCSARQLVGQAVTYQNYKLNKLIDGYQLTLPSGAIETYSTTGQLTSTTSSQGSKLTYSYQANSITTTDEFSQQITLTTNNDNLVTQADTPIGSFTYSYDDFNRLTTVTKPDTSTIGYRYDEVGFSTVQYYESSEQACSGDDYLTIEACKLLVKGLGLLTGKIDEKGQRYASWYYDEQQRAYKSEHSIGIDATEIQFVSEEGEASTDVQGNAITLQRMRDTISPLGLRTRTTFKSPYAQRAEKIEIFDISSNLVSAETYSYDSNGYEAEYIDVNGLKTTYSRYSDGREFSRIENTGTADARTISTSYSGNTNKPSQITTPETRININYISHNSGLLVSQQTTTDLSTNKQRITKFTYDTQGQLISIDGSRTGVSDITTFEYNAQGLKNKTTNALGHVTQVTAFNTFGKPVTLIDENNVITTLGYDVMGRLTSMQRAGTESTFEYDLTGNLIKTTRANGSVLEYEYDFAKRLTAIKDGAGNRIEYTLDVAGNQLSTQVKGNTGTLLQTQQQLFDEFSRLVSITNATSNSTQFDYLANGNLNKTTDAANNPTNNAFDNLQRLTEIHDAEGGKTAFDYDNAGRTTSITDATGKATTYIYNGFGELIKQVSPDSGETSFVYDEAGNLASETDARGITVSYQYDALNRLTQTTYPDTAENISFTYDNTTNGNKGIGRLTGVTEAAGNRSYHYGALGQLLSEAYSVGGQSYSVGYQYDSAGQLIGVTYPSGRTLTYSLNAEGQISAMTTLASGQNQTSQTLLTAATYLPFGPLSNFSYGNGLVNSYSFDKNYRLTAHTLTGLKNETLSYSALSNIDAITDTVNSDNNYNFGYDKLSRLLSSADNNNADTNGDFTFTYDAIGNRQSKLNSDTTENYSYIANTHHLEKVTIDKKVQVPSYSSSFNQAKRMTSTSYYGVTTQYQYNYRELRVSKTTTGEPAVITHYHYDASGLLIAESDGNGVWLKEYVYFNGQLIAMVDFDNGVAQRAYAVHTDHLGTPTQITNATGTLVWQASYSPFGLANINNDVDGDSATVELNVRFLGQYYDAETGLHYNWHRYYDPSVGRYITSDPLGLAAGMNTYGYVGGNPVMEVDPSGLAQVSGPAIPGLVPGLPIFIPPVAQPGTVENDAWVAMISDLLAKIKNGLKKGDKIACEEYDDDYCRGLIERLYQYMAKLDEKYLAALIDKQDQYLQFVTGKQTSGTSWVTHKDQYENFQKTLSRTANSLDQLGCEYDRASVKRYLSRPFPNTPIRN